MKVNPDDQVTATIEFMVGLTTRELFAAMAMQGFCASTAGNDFIFDIKDIARSSVKCADALIEELNKEEKDE